MCHWNEWETFERTDYWRVAVKMILSHYNINKSDFIINGLYIKEIQFWNTNCHFAENLGFAKHHLGNNK
jgi:hypothetical protein